MLEHLKRLERTDKHYLGSGGGIIFAPRFPRWLDWPGFWDELDVHHFQLAPVFTVSFLLTDETSPGRPLALRQQSRVWTPAELVARYEMQERLTGEEHRSVLPGGQIESAWRITNSGTKNQTLLAVAWTIQEAGAVDLSTVRTAAGRVRFTRELVDRRGHCLSTRFALDVPNGLAGAAYLAEPSSLEPRWELTPFPEKWRQGDWTARQVEGTSENGMLYAAVAAPVELPAGGRADVTLLARVEPRGLKPVPSPASREAAVRVSEPAPLAAGESSAAAAEPGSESRSAWSAYFESLPQLSCSDPFIERYWYYRWYGLRLCAHAGGVGNHVYPGCCEGTGYFHVPIAYSAQCHARELRWLPDPDRARGVILNFLVHQKQSGGLHGRVYVDRLEGTDFYFADWGGAVLAVDAVHPDQGFLRAVYEPLTRYANWLDRNRDADRTGLYDVIDHYETGQEYMSRYIAVSPDADSETWGNRIRLKAVDATVYTYQLQRALAEIAGRLQEFGEAARWTAVADRTATAVQELMWDAKSCLYSDVDPRTLRRTGVKAAVCFYPYFTDLVKAEHMKGLREHLLNPSEFWTPYPVPSTSADDPYFSADAEWKGKRHNCPWNGRVWPMANSHVAEAINHAAIEHDPALREPAVDFMRRFISMMFHEGDPARPNCYEHYNPETGQPCLYRGFDDYQHSWVNDLIVKYVAGFRPAAGDAFVVDPFPFGLGSLELVGLPFRGRQIGIEISAERFSVSVDGVAAAESRLGEPARVTL